MKRALILAFVLLSCNNQKMIKEEGLSGITVTVNRFNASNNGVTYIQQAADTFTIVDKSKTSAILKVVNTAKKEIVKFYPDYKLQLNYSDSTQLVFVKNDLCKINGVSYRMSDKIDKLLK